MVTTADVKKLREETGAGVMDSKRALEEADGDFERARELLRERGVVAAAKRADRATSEGLVESYIHADGRLGALVEVNCETDFVARTETFKTLAHDIAMHVVAMDPQGLAPEDVPEDAVGSPEEQALMTQPFFRDPARTVSDLIQEAMSQTGENVRVSRFARFELGS